MSCVVSCSSINQVPYFILNKVVTEPNLTRLLLRKKKNVTKTHFIGHVFQSLTSLDIEYFLLALWALQQSSGQLVHAFLRTTNRNDHSTKPMGYHNSERVYEPRLELNVPCQRIALLVCSVQEHKWPNCIDKHCFVTHLVKTKSWKYYVRVRVNLKYLNLNLEVFWVWNKIPIMVSYRPYGSNCQKQYWSSNFFLPLKVDRQKGTWPGK